MALALLVLATGCDKSPTGPTRDAVPTFPFGAASCTPSADTTIHTVNLPGSPTPLRVWLTEITPAKGSTIRSGQAVSWRIQRDGPTGFSASVFAGLTNGPGTPIVGFAAGGGGNTEPCRAMQWSSAATQFPAQLTGPVHLRLRVWVTVGNLIPGPPPLLSGREPDYEADEPLDWTIAR